MMNSPFSPKHRWRQSFYHLPAYPLTLGQTGVGQCGRLCFFSNWSNFQAPLIYLTTIEKFTISVGLRLYLSTIGNNMHWNYLMAATLVSITPPVLIFFTSQQYFVEGAVLTGVKG